MTNGKIVLLLTASSCGVALSTVVFNPSLYFWNCVGIALLLTACRNLDDKAFRATAVILGINMILMSLLYWGYLAKYNVPYFLGNSDDYVYDQYAVQVIAEGLYTPNQIQGSDDFTFFNSTGYICYLSWIVRISSFLGGYHPLTPRVLNLYYLTILSVLTYKYFQRHMDLATTKSRLLIYWLGLFPNAVYVSIHNFRDVLSSLLLFIVFYFWDSFLQKKFSKKVAIVLMTLFIAYWMYWIRSITLLFIAIFIITSLLLGNRSFKFKLKSLFAMAVVVIVLVQVANAIGFFKLLDVYNKIYTEGAVDLSSGLSQTVFMAPLVPFGFLLRALYGMIIPVPALPIVFDIEGLFQVLNSCGTISQILLLPYLLLNFKTIDKLVIAFVAIYLAIILTTFGFRHFIMLYPFMAMMIAREYFTATSVRHHQFLYIMVGTLTALLPLYIFLKA